MYTLALYPNGMIEYTPGWESEMTTVFRNGNDEIVFRRYLRGDVIVVQEYHINLDGREDFFTMPETMVEELRLSVRLCIEYNPRCSRRVRDAALAAFDQFTPPTPP